MINKKVLGLLGLATKAGKVCFGYDACTDLIQRKKVILVIVAENSADRTKRNMEDICKRNNIKIYFYATIDELSNAIGKQNKAIIGVKDENFAKEIEKIISGGEAIG